MAIDYASLTLLSQDRLTALDYADRCGWKSTARGNLLHLLGKHKHFCQAVTFLGKGEMD